MAKAEQGAPAARLTRKQIDALSLSDEWQAKANREARKYAPRIYPCGACGEPVVDGYCCTACGDSNPRQLAEARNG